MDRVFAKELQRLQNGSLTVFEADILTFPLHTLSPNFKVVANLPYHITTPILEILFSQSFSSLTIMVQKEVAERMAALAGSKTYGSLSLFVQFHSHIHATFKVPASCFYPQPKVESAVIRLNRRDPPDVPPSFFPLIHKAFQHRRKMLTSTLPKEATLEALKQLGIRLDARPEMLSLDQWVELTRKIESICPSV
jgi:16S rRNA (adenine1518-N6/adenine1519-N6)-dimethyltransferase